MKRALYVSNVLAHIESFHIPYIKMLKQNGYEVDVLTNTNGANKPEYCNNLYDVCIERNPFHLNNIKAIKTAKKIIDSNQYDLIHVHTPMGGTVGRLAARRTRKTGTKVIYTSHGFHFYTGAPLVNWLIYFFMEKYLARFTDCLITINNEDYGRARRFSHNKFPVYYMDGVGVDLSRFSPADNADKIKRKAEKGYNDFLIVFYAAEFIDRKNHEFLLDAFATVVKEVPKAKLLLAGKGPLLEKMKKKCCDLGIEEQVEFLGYRKDIPDLLAISDITVSTSRQEGFPINVAESIATCVPAVVSDIRGNIDIVEDNKNGLVYSQNNKKNFSEKVIRILKNEDLRSRLASNCFEMTKKIDVHTLVDKMASIYSSVTNNNFGRM